MNGFELFAEEVLLLRFIDVAAHVLRDLAFQTRDLQFRIQALLEEAQPLHEAALFQKFLFDDVFEPHLVRADVDVHVGIGDARERSVKVLGGLALAA